MTEIQEAILPGVGIRHDFETEDGQHIGIISHRGGRRDLLVYDRRDPDACALSLRLEPEDARILAELLGGTRVTESLMHLQQTVQGLTIDWLPVSTAWACAGRSIGDSQLRRRTGVTIVAVARDKETFPSPTPDFVLQAGDTVVVVGTPDGIYQAQALLQNKLPV